MWNESSVGLGGGFLDESVNGTEGGKKSSQNNIKNIVPVLIKHITGTRGDLCIAGKSVHIVTIVGIVRHIEQETTKISYTIQDDTGNLTAIMWLEADRNPAEDIQINTYVRIHGLTREQSNQRQVLILRIHPLEDLNELTCHFMEVMYFILKSNKPVEENMPQQAIKYENTMSGMTMQQIKILEIIRSANDAECGIEKSNILAQVPKPITPQVVDDILEFLLSEGHIYTTSSEDVFKAT